MSSNREFTENFWGIFHSCIRKDEQDIDSTQCCKWVSDNQTHIKNVFYESERNIIGFINSYYYDHKDSPSLEMLQKLNTDNNISDIGVFGKIDSVINDYIAMREDITVHGFRNINALMQKKAEEFNVDSLNNILDVCKVVNNIGATIKRNGAVVKNIKGPEDSLTYFMRNIKKTYIISDRRTECNNEDAEEYLKELFYEADNSTNSKIKCGINSIDDKISFKKKDFVGVLASGGQCKTAFCKTWAYNAALQGFNVLHVTIEMGLDTEMTDYIIMHSHHPKFGAKFDIKIKNYRDNKLTKEEREFLIEVARDLKENVPGKLIVKQLVDDCSWEHIKILTEVINNEIKIDMLFVDYMTLCTLSSDNPNAEVSQHEENIKDARRFSENFNEGEGLLLLTPVQGNRTGYEVASKDEGRWDVTGIYKYSEFYKSMTILLSLWFDDDKKADNQVVVSSIKSRGSQGVNVHPINMNFEAGLFQNTKVSGKFDREIELDDTKAYINRLRNLSIEAHDVIDDL